MGSMPPLLQFLLMIAAGWVHRHQLIVIEFLQAENRLLKDRLRGRRIRFTELSAPSSRGRPKPWVERPCLTSTPLCHQIPCCDGIDVWLPRSGTSLRVEAQADQASC